jgi:hypothetical protein
MYAATSVLQSGDYKKETNEWEGRNANKKTWTKWKQAYLAAYARGINHQRAGATDEPFTRAANSIMPAATTDVMDALVGSLDNLVLAATSNKTALQQLMAANLALTTTHTSATCLAANRLPGHDASATVADTKGGKEWNKNWYLRGNKDT